MLNPLISRLQEEGAGVRMGPQAWMGPFPLGKTAFIFLTLFFKIYLAFDTDFELPSKISQGRCIGNVADF